MRQSSLRILIRLAEIFGYPIWSQEVAHAYLQSTQRMKRKVFLKTQKEFQLASDERLELPNPLYGFTDAGDYWHDTF